MCRPSYFDVHYSINVWMDPNTPVDRDLAVAQWETVRAGYEQLGHVVELLEPRPGLPDMVFAANGAFVVGDRALGARFREPVRAAEAPAHHAKLRSLGVTVHEGRAFNEGEGDFVWTGDRILAGAGFRADRAARAELTEVFGLPVVPLELVDPRFYHLDTALAVLDHERVAYYPPAFSAESQVRLAEMYPDAVICIEDDALVLGLNFVSDGRNVVIASQAEKLAAGIEEAGFGVVPVDVSELLKAGGGIKCTTQELHAWPTTEEVTA